MGIAAADFEFIRDFVYRVAAIVLEPGKEYLVETRLAAVASECTGGSLSALIALLRGGDQDRSVLSAQVIDALTTNETLFFRDFHPFESLRKTHIPALLAARQSTRTLSIWSAACATGQEPVSLAILLRHHFPELSTWRIRLLATDLSGRALARARAGVYSQFEVNRGLPAPLLTHFFRKQGDHWQVQDSIRSMIDYQPRNLACSWPTGEQFDLVLLRNVLIYFDDAVKQGILSQVRERLAPGGILMLGGGESPQRFDPHWAAVRTDNTTVWVPCLPGSAA